MLQLLKELPVLRDPSARRFLKQLPGIRHTKRAIRKTRRAYYRNFGKARLKRMLAAPGLKRIVIGAWSRYDSGWIPTQQDFLDLTKPADWQFFFQPDSMDAMLAEHVWEHLTEEEGLAAARTCFTYLKPGGYLRVAVPDGFHPDPTYIAMVKAGATNGNGASGPKTALDGNGAHHKALYTYRSLRQLFESAGFMVQLYEYFDEQGEFHCREWNREAGTIWRSKRFDPRNKQPGGLKSVYPGSLGDYLSYSSIILDAVKS
jgi:predicted SAM-dependent methyltransferase